MITKNQRKIVHSLILASFLLLTFTMCKKNGMTKNMTQTVPTMFYVGTYTNNKSEGIYKYSLLSNGNIKFIGLAAKSENPSFLTKSLDNKFLLAVNENKIGTVESYKIHIDSLEFVSRASSGGEHPCFVAINNERYVVTANYSSGNVGLIKLASNGVLSSLLNLEQHYGKGSNVRQDAPHAHSIWFNPFNNDIISVDLGTNELNFATIDTLNNKFVPKQQSKLKMDLEAGPRHLAFHPKKKWLYVINELSSTVSFVNFENDRYSLVSSISTLPQNFTEQNTCADIHISNDGKFLYASNRGHNSIAVFSIQKDGNLKLIEHEPTRGNGPRNFKLSPNNNFIVVANQYTDNLVSFRRDPQTGKLKFIFEIEAYTPVCILF